MDLNFDANKQQLIVSLIENFKEKHGQKNWRTKFIRLALQKYNVIIQYNQLNNIYSKDNNGLNIILILLCETNNVQPFIEFLK